MHDFKTNRVLAGILLAMIFGRNVAGQDFNLADGESEPKTWFNLELGTWGGMQFWTDYLHFHGYRIQKNSVTGHCRLLDPSDHRLVWGNFAGCRKELERVAVAQSLGPMKGKVVITLHGLSRTRSSMTGLAEYVERESEMKVINMSYASGRGGVEDHAEALRSIILNLPEVEEFCFVGHSLGNIVIRYYLGRYGGDARFRRMVMLGPPNQGSAMARLLQNNLVFRSVTGLSGQQLSRRFEEIRGTLAVPPFEFAIIAGSTGENGGLSNPLLDDENDMTVTVSETRLPGAADFMAGDFWHSSIMKQSAVHEATLNFLENGYLLAADRKTPIPIDQPVPEK